MSEANKIQHGGNHYRDAEYQHWDFATDMGMPYLIGCATKYVARWRKKNGAEDLRKAQHYLQKATERSVKPIGEGRSVFSERADAQNLDQFCAQLDKNDALAIRHIVRGHYEDAAHVIGWMLDNIDQED